MDHVCHETDGQTDGSLSTQSSRTSLRLGWESFFSCFFRSNVKSVAVGSTFNIFMKMMRSDGQKKAVGASSSHLKPAETISKNGNKKVSVSSLGSLLCT